MHRDFARWYATVSVDHDVARRDARWEGVSAVVTDAERPTVEALLRLAFGGRALPATQTVHAIRQAFSAADETFEMSGNDRELQILAAASLVVLMEDLDEAEGSTAALAASTAFFAGARKPDLPMDLAALAEAAIVKRADAIRVRPSLAAFATASVPKFKFETAVAKLREKADFNGVAEAFTVAADLTRTNLLAVAERSAKGFQAVDSFIRVQDEELQMLWWLTGQRSEVYDCAFETVGADAQPFIFAMELADHTEFPPGPPSVKALMSRAGLKEGRKISIATAVNAVRPAVLAHLVSEADCSPLSTPLHAAIKRQLETGAGMAWVAGWAATAGVDEAYALPGLTLGELFYRERLLISFG
jgi:hypothetical protein